MARNKLLTEGEVRKFMKLANLGPLSENYFTNNPLDEQEDEFGAEDELGTGDEFEVGAVEDEVPLDDAGLEGEEEGGEAEDLVVDLLQHIQDWGEQHGVDMDLGVDGEEGGEEEELEVDAELGGPEGDVEMEFGAEEEEVPGNADLYQENWNTPSASGATSSTKAGKQDRSDVANKATGRWLKEEEEEIDEVFGGVASTKHPERRQSAARTGKKCYDSDSGNRVDCADQQADSAADASRAGETRQQMEELNQEEIVAEVSRRVAARLMVDQKKDNMADQLAERIFSRLTAK
jgi:hypothetical protein